MVSMSRKQPPANAGFVEQTIAAERTLKISPDRRNRLR